MRHCQCEELANALAFYVEHYGPTDAAKRAIVDHEQAVMQAKQQRKGAAGCVPRKSYKLLTLDTFILSLCRNFRNIKTR